MALSILSCSGLRASVFFGEVSVQVCCPLFCTGLFILLLSSADLRVPDASPVDAPLRLLGSDL